MLQLFVAERVIKTRTTTHGEQLHRHDLANLGLKPSLALKKPLEESNGYMTIRSRNERSVDGHLFQANQ